MNKHAQQLGRLGGKIGGRSKSPAKIAAARRNGLKGGRPKKESSLCDWEIRKAVGDHFEFRPCGKPGKVCAGGPQWQIGAVRCPKHTKFRKHYENK